MAGRTKKAIKESFVRLLEERPYSKITVKDIVDSCGINRNSFYYHYADIPSLLDEILQEEVQKVIRAYPSIYSVEECTSVIIRNALEHRKFVLHIYHSVAREAYEQHLWRLCELTVQTYFRTLFPNVVLSPADREAIYRYYKCECFGSVTDWLASGMSYDMEAYNHRLFELRRGVVEQIIRHGEALREQEMQ